MAVLGETLDSLWAEISTKNIFDAVINSNVATAVVILIVGIIVSRIFSDIVRRLLVIANTDTYLAKIDARRFFRAIGYGGGFSDLVASIVRWLLYAVVAFSAAYALGFFDVMVFISYALMYLSKILIAAGLFVVGLIIGESVKQGTIKMLRVNEAERMDPIGTEMPIYSVMGAAAKCLVVFAFVLFALATTGIGTEITYLIFGVLFAGFVLLLILSIKDVAKNMIISIYFQRSNTLLKDQNITVGDIHGKMVSMGPLYTKIRKKDETVLVPNNMLLKNTVKIKS
ncbi:MAG: mechanosensitive ion channel family protein [Candidatus Aenigmarchaeota archaeon]|nr:mechanosensitive ion channel family protein [Candidatus Aenigmarchaeota archaeon]